MTTNDDIMARPLARTSRFLFAVLAWVFLGFILVQVLLAGVGLFVDADQWRLHGLLPRFFALVPLVMFGLSLLGRLPGFPRWISLGMFLMTSLQFMTVALSSRFEIVGAAHPVIALFLFWSAVKLIGRIQHKKSV